ncbi:Likely vesicular transport factor Uso1p [uncultured Candidatus Thioglobus sp.]|nr:Likely vesicular transport factor Uso1p [uncultured Candidatus Thioglobus sp.]
MENKSLFSSIVFAFALIAGYFFYTDKITELETEIQATTQEYNTKLDALQSTPGVNKSNDSSALEALNNQLIGARSALKIAQQKLSLVTSKTSVLGSEISQMSDARDQVKTLQGSLQSAKQKLSLSAEKVSYLEDIFTTQNTQRVIKNITRIESLKETTSGIAITGLIVPAIGIATLVSYTNEEIDNYCDNIKDTMELENKIFGKVVSLGVDMQKSYHNQCEVSLKEKIKKNLKKLRTGLSQR